MSVQVQVRREHIHSIKYIRPPSASTINSPPRNRGSPILKHHSANSCLQKSPAVEKRHTHAAAVRPPLLLAIFKKFCSACSRVSISAISEEASSNTRGGWLGCGCGWLGAAHVSESVLNEYRCEGGGLIKSDGQAFQFCAISEEALSNTRVTESKQFVDRSIQCFCHSLPQGSLIHKRHSPGGATGRSCVESER